MLNDQLNHTSHRAVKEEAVECCTVRKYNRHRSSSSNVSLSRCYRPLDQLLGCKCSRPIDLNPQSKLSMTTQFCFCSLHHADASLASSKWTDTTVIDIQVLSWFSTTMTFRGISPCRNPVAHDLLYLHVRTWPLQREHPSLSSTRAISPVACARCTPT